MNSTSSNSLNTSFSLTILDRTLTQLIENTSINLNVKDVENFIIQMRRMVKREINQGMGEEARLALHGKLCQLLSRVKKEFRIGERKELTQAIIYTANKIIKGATHTLPIELKEIIIPKEKIKVTF